MKIQFLKTYRDPYDTNRYYQPGWVAEFTDTDAERAIAEGFAKPAPVDAFCRKYAAPNLITSDCVVTPAQPSVPEEAFAKAWEMNATGEEIALEELTAQKPQVIPKTGKFRL